MRIFDKSNQKHLLYFEYGKINADIGLLCFYVYIRIS